MLITISGPQSSGKTTALKFVRKTYPTIPVISETDVRTIAGENHLGGAFVTKHEQELILQKDIEIISSFDRDISYVVFECGIMHMIYAEEQFGEKEIQNYYDQFISAHSKLKTTVFFIDTLPEISWKRRKKIYRERISKAGIINPSEVKKMMKTYRTTIFSRYPLWKKWIRKLPFQKIIIENNHNSEKKFLEDFKKVFEKLISSRPSPPLRQLADRGGLRWGLTLE